MLFPPFLVIAASFVDATSLMQHPSYASPELPAAPASLILALDYDNSDPQTRPETASLQLPAAIEENRDDRRCMTVCSGWGEECVMLSPGAGAVTRKCVRTCKSFSEECL